MNNIFTKVLYVGPDHSNHRGGIGAVLSVYAKHIPEFKFIFSFRATNSIYKSIIFVNSIFWLFFKLLFDWEIKIVHIHGSHGASVYRKSVLILISLIFRKKIVYHLHASSYDQYYDKGGRFYRWLCRWTIANCDVLITLSESWHKYYSSTFNPKRLQIMKNVIDYREATLSTTSMDIHSPMIFVFLGRIGHRKGIFDILNAVASNKDFLIGKMKLVIGGDGEVSQLTKLINDNKLNEIVEYIGWTDGVAKSKVLDQGDVLLLPSYNEGLPISILEAMNYGMPIIASKVGGIPEVVKDKANGFLVDAGSEEQIAAAMLQMITMHNKDFNKMQDESLRIVQDYLPESIITDLKKLYSTLC